MTAPEPRADKPPFEVTASRHFVDWLAASGVSIALTTYHSNRLFLVGIKPNGRLSVLNRLFERAMGLAAAGDRLLLATRYQLWQFENVLKPGEREGDYDRLYKPHLAWTTGDVDVHDLVFADDGAPLFVNSLFSCLATVDSRHSFRPLWQPPWISKLAPEDRCHLNGLALENGRPRYTTAVAATDVAAAWREKRRDGGVVVEIDSGEIVARGLSMPHSPRMKNGELWLVNSGTGELGVIDARDGSFEPVCFCPGYLRGLAFAGEYALVGLSQCREERTFSGLALDDKLREKGTEARCGLAVVDTRTGALAHWLDFAGTVRELYDVQVLPGARCPGALGLRTKEIWGVVTHEEDGRLVRHTGIPAE
jgi:uncharacterized protein (TIGR03032 family)